MGAKQSKRSVDISGKEAEGGGEVAAAGAGGEGRVEALADADALKPQLNGDAHIQPEPTTDKEKQLDSGTPENEKDATTEKEGKEEKEESDKEAEAAPLANGEPDEKADGADAPPAPEDGKKHKKEKVKKKWSLRSISFSRKDKPKQEKKQKDEEPKTNGEPEKVPEETAEAATAAEPVAEEVATEAPAAEAPAVEAPAVEVAPANPVPAAPADPAPAAPAAVPEEKEEATAETPVTEPLTNGAADSSPEEPPASPLQEPSPDAPAPQPEQLPVNGLSLEEPHPEVPAEEPKPAPLADDALEITPAPEIPAKEVCVEQMPLLESTPPPLPANPPPSSVASFAASTMAPELAPAGPAPPAADAPSDTLARDDTPLSPLTSNCDAALPPSPAKDSSEDVPVEPASLPAPANLEPELAAAEASLPTPDHLPTPPSEDALIQTEEPEQKHEALAETTEAITESIPEEAPPMESSPEPKIEQIPSPENDTSSIESEPLPPPPAVDDEPLDRLNGNGLLAEELPEVIAPLTNGAQHEETDICAENAKNKAKAAVHAENGLDKMDCNGVSGDSPPAADSAEAAPPSPPPAAHTPQELVSVCDKLADLIPEVPDVPEINTGTMVQPARAGSD